MLENPAYKGMAGYGRRRVGEMRPRLRAKRGAKEQPRRAYSLYKVPDGWKEKHLDSSEAENIQAEHETDRLSFFRRKQSLLGEADCKDL